MFSKHGVCSAKIAEAEMKNAAGYYVYVYIDPRNNEEFYYGKGKDNRKDAHLFDRDDSKEKVKRIKAIRKAGQQPICRVIAAGLTESQALAIETAFIWKFHHTLTNVASGNLGLRFRPYNTLHLALKDFDYDNGIYLLNVGEGPHRSWADCLRYGFMSAGQGKRYRRLMQDFQSGDIVAAYWSKKGQQGGYVGIGIVDKPAVEVNRFEVNGRPLRKLRLKQRGIFENCDDPDKAEWVIAVKWIKTFGENERKWQSKAGLFSTPSTKASLERQITTLRFLEEKFDLKFDKIRT
jgi:uncharacterized protein